jgi:hypothetical protein
MLDQTNSSILVSFGKGKESSSSAPAMGFAKKKQRILALPGLTGPVLMMGSARVKTASQGTICRDIMSLAADILDLRAWRRMDPVSGFILAAYVAAVGQPLVYGGLGGSIVALMTPVK